MLRNSNLLAKRDQLIAENKSFKLEYEEKLRNSEINNTIASMKNKTGERGGKYGQLIFHPEYRSKWKGTFFDNQRVLVENLNAYPLNRLWLFKDGNKNNPYGSVYDECPIDFIGLCDMVSSSKYGPVIRISDPYGNYTFPPLQKTPFEEAAKWNGRIIVVSCSFKYERKNPIVTGVKVLEFTLHDDLRKII